MSEIANQVEITSKELVDIINNKDKKYQLQGKQYILIIKDQLNRPCTLYLTDCEEAIWSKTIDLSFFVKLKEELQLASPIKVFAAHFVSSLQKSSFIQKLKTVIRLHIELQIGEGLVMSCCTRIDSRVHYNNPDEFKKALHKFMINLWKVKCMQISDQNDKFVVEKKENEEKQKKQKQSERLVFKGDKFASKNQQIKKRNLMNPQKKKRKTLGAKLGTGYESDMYGTTPYGNMLEDL